MKKRIIPLLLVFAVTFLLVCGTVTAFAAAAGTALIAGDVNGDGSVDPKDTTTLRRYIADYDVDIVLALADINGDGSVDPKDTTILRRYIAGYDVDIFIPCEHTGMDDCVCDNCGYVSHTFDGKWYYNENGHWQYGSCGNSDHTGNYAEHSDENSDCLCDVCGCTTHTYSEEWSKNETHHWHEAVCSHKNEMIDYATHKLGIDGKCECGYNENGEIELPIVPA